MALIHNVIDSDVRFIIDPVTRTISNQGSKKLVLTRGDHNSERFTFEIPRYVEGHDMSLCNVVRIHFINTDSRARQEMADIYEPDDASLLDTNDQLFTFSWLIERTATTFAGPLAFAIEFQCVVDGTIVYSWRTAANSTITIVDGINNANSTDVEVDMPPTDVYAAIRVATVASMIHDVIDSDVRFLIDPVTRSISNQDSKKLMLIRGDHKSERFTFEIPQFVEGHDMSLCNVVRIHYINTNSKTRSVMADVYEPTDMAAQPGNIVTFSWLIGRSATTFAGTLAFSIEFQCIVGDVVEYSWHTGVNNTIGISDGISNAEVVNEEYSDILTIWWERLYSSSELPIEIITQDMFKALGDRVQDNTLYILEDDPTLDEIENVIEKTKEFETELTKHLKEYEALDKSMVEHLETYTKLDKNISEHFEDFATLLSKMKLLEERVRKIENGSSSEICDHAWTETVVDPTCTERGYTRYICSKCDYSYNDSYTDATGHVWSYVQQGPDLWDRHCSVCGEEENDVEFLCIDNTEHSWEELAAVDATCTTAAIRRYKCGKCDATKDGEIIEALGHEIIFDTGVNPTCTTDGWIRYKCSRCDHTEIKTVSADGHTYVNGVCTACGANEYGSGSDPDNPGTTDPEDPDNPEDPDDPGSSSISYSVKVDETFIIPYSAMMSDINVIYPEEYLSASIGTNKTTFTALKVGSCTITVAKHGIDFCNYSVTISEKASGEGSGSDPDNPGTTDPEDPDNPGTTDPEDPDNPGTTDPEHRHVWSYIQQGPDLWDRQCSVCGTKEYDVEFLCYDDKAHDWKELEPTTVSCTEASYRRYHCDVCDATKHGEIIQAALGHNMIFDTGVNETCTTDGWIRFKCSMCEYEETEPVYASGHTLGNPDYGVAEAYEPTCTTPGYANFTCSVCKEDVWATVPALQHDYKDEIVEPTCVDGGYTLRKCTRDGCGYSFTVPGSQTAALGHDYNSVVTAATCETGGYTTYTCKRTGCTHSYTGDTTAALGHQWSDWIIDVEPKCLEDGEKHRECTRPGCGEIDKSTAEATGHGNQTYHSGKAATCTESGYTEYYTCDVCDEIVSGKTTIDKLGHALSTSPAIEPTCTEYGRTALTTCSQCDYSSGGESIEPNGHSFPDGWVEHEAPTCTENGVKRRYCTNCSYYESDPIPATGHSYTSKVTAATCTTGGYTTHTCSECGHSYTDNETEPNGHSFPDGWVEHEAPTCTENGVKRRYCVNCSYYEADPIPAGHAYITKPIDPDNYPGDGVSSSGYVDVCTRCGDRNYDSHT